MIEISNEQKEIVDFLIEGSNVIVDACAGSGKSTTILWAAKLMPELDFIIITYNSMFLPINSDHHAVYGIFKPIK
jgi:hypothetical protein